MTRFLPAAAPEIADGWRMERLTPPSRLHGANGMARGADGRIYVAECVGSRISARLPNTPARAASSTWVSISDPTISIS